MPITFPNSPSTGDTHTTSNGLQYTYDGDIVRSKTITKVISTTVSETYSDGSYCVPCVLMAC